MKKEKKTCKQFVSSEILNSNMHPEKFRLKKQFGILYGMSMTIGLVIGSGIFLTPQTVVENAGSPGLTLIVWLAAGLNAFIGSLVDAEIGLYYPCSGGVYTYICELCNPFLGIYFLWWLLFIFRSVANSLKIMVFARYILKPLYENCEIPQSAILTLASAMSIIISALNCLKVKVTARAQSIFTSLTLISLIIVICFGLHHVIKSDSIENFDKPFQHSCTSPVCFISAFYAASFSYMGWSALNVITEEVQNPSKNLPVVILLSTTLTTFLYVTVNFVYLAVLERTEILSSQAIAITLVTKISLIGGWLISILIGLSSCSSFNSATLIGSRLAYVAARNGHLPRCLSFVNIKFVSPIVSVIILNIFTLLFCWMFDVNYLIANIAFGVVTFDLLKAACYLRLRIIKQNEFKNYGKFKMPIAIHAVYTMMTFFFTSIPLISNFMASTVLTFVVLVVTTIYYYIYVKEKLKSKWINNISEKIELFIQKILYCAPEERED